MPSPSRRVRRGALSILFDVTNDRALSESLEKALYGASVRMERASASQLENESHGTGIYGAGGTNHAVLSYEVLVRRAVEYCGRDNALKTIEAIVNAVIMNDLCAAEVRFRESLALAEEKRETAINLIQKIGSETGATIRCRRCKSDNVAATMKQLRSADEGMTTCYSCGSCGASWRD